MTRRRTPQEKKQDEYTKDHIVFKGQGPGVRVSGRFRRNWPQKKAYAKRAYRREVQQRLTGISAGEPDISATSLDPAELRRKPVRKWWHSVVPLGEVIEGRRQVHALGPTQSFFVYDYDQGRDRTRFSMHLSSQVSGRTENSRLLASYFLQLMDPSTEGHWAANEYISERGQRWLRTFFQDEPEWEERLRTWIASFEKE